MYFRLAGSEDVDWIYLAEDRDEWLAPVNAVIKFLGSIKL